MEKAYFILKDYLQDSLNSESSGLKLQSYKVDDVETLTNDFFFETQGIPFVNPALYFDFCYVQPDGSLPIPSTVSANSFNPFAYSFKTQYALTNGLRRGDCLGSLTGSDYGGAVNFGVDKPAVHAQNTGLMPGAFYLNIDFTKNLEIKFDVVTNIMNGQVYENPITLRTYTILWNKCNCYREFSFVDVLTLEEYNASQYGFLRGAIDKVDYIEDPFLDFSLIECGCDNDNCDNKEKTIRYALGVSIPEEDVDREKLKECCYNQYVFATDDDNEAYEKNDFTGLFHARQTQNETVEFVLIDLGSGDEIILNDNTYGEFKAFDSIEDNPNLTTFVLNWKKVLMDNTLGTGMYTVFKRITILGREILQGGINYTLKKYTDQAADKTVRIDGFISGFMERIQTDFKNSNFRTSLRFGGFFGRREPKFEEDNIIYSNYVSTQISMHQTNEYALQSNLIPSCITQQIIDFLLFADDIYINDYNLNNHIREFIRFPVKYADNKGTEYYSITTKAMLNLVFSDKKVDNVKRNFS